jgi:hypothetical protein
MEPTAGEEDRLEEYRLGEEGRPPLAGHQAFHDDDCGAVVNVAAIVVGHGKLESRTIIAGGVRHRKPRRRSAR